MLGEPCLQRLQPPASAADPVCQGRAIDLDTLPGEDLALPVKRQVIAVFGDQDMREKTGSGEALGDRTLRGGRLVDGPAGPAAIARPADADDSDTNRSPLDIRLRTGNFLQNSANNRLSGGLWRLRIGNSTDILDGCTASRNLGLSILF